MAPGGADHEVVGDDDRLADVQDHDVARLLVGRRAGGHHGHLSALRVDGLLPGRRRLLVRQAVKSFPITIVTSANPDGTSVTARTPTPSALRARSASGTCSLPVATTSVLR